jgi:hypothetical protein
MEVDKSDGHLPRKPIVVSMNAQEGRGKTSMMIVGDRRSKNKRPLSTTPTARGRKVPLALGARDSEHRVNVGGRNTELTSEQSVEDEINPPKALAQEGLGEKKEIAETNPKR